MMNNEHVDKLRESPFEFNQWRSTNPNITPDLSGALLDGVNAKGANLRGARLKGASLKKADLSNATLAEADLAQADLSEAILHGTNLQGTSLFSARLIGCTGSQTDFRRASLLDADLTRAELAQPMFSDTDVSGMILKEASLRGADVKSLAKRGAVLDEVKKDDAPRPKGKTTPKQVAILVTLIIALGCAVAFGFYRTAPRNPYEQPPDSVTLDSPHIVPAGSTSPSSAASASPGVRRAGANAGPVLEATLNNGSKRAVKLVLFRIILKDKQGHDYTTSLGAADVKVDEKRTVTTSSSVPSDAVVSSVVPFRIEWQN